MYAQDCQTKSAPPSASFDASCTTCPYTWTFTITSPLSGVSMAEWDFGDGSPISTVGSHTYPRPGRYTVMLTVTLADGQIVIATDTIGIGDSSPLAFDDTFTAEMGVPLTISTAELLSNDAPGVTFVSTSPGPGGRTCSVSADGLSCSYQPPTLLASERERTDSFIYTVRDMGGRTGSATVFIGITQPLVAAPDYFSMDLKDVKFLDIPVAQLLANDTPKGVAVFVRAENPLHGSLQLLETGMGYRFTPEPCFVGDATFEYLISWDGNPPYERGVVTITVAGGPHALFTARCGVPPDPPRLCRVDTTSKNDSCGPLRYFWNWGDGTPTFEVTTPYGWAPQSHTYATSGRFTITHTVIDEFGQSNSLQLDIVPNTRPVAVADSATTDRDVPVTIPVLANDTDADGDALTINSVTLTQPGAGYQIVPNGTSWAVRFTPPDSFVGTANFSYVAADRWGGASASTGVAVTVKQWTVIVDALGEQFYTPQNTSLRIPLSTLLSNDYSDNGPLTIVSYDTAILMGTLDCTTETTACTYRPPINGAGLTLFKYKACDPAGHCDTATVRIYVSFRGTGPAAASDYFTTTRNTAKTFTIQELVQNDSDADGDTLSIGLIGGAKDFGSLACSTPMYKCTYTPNTGFVGTDRFQYTATDGMNAPVSAFVNVLTLPPATPAFDAREDMKVTALNQQMYISYAALTANDFDPAGSAITVASVDPAGLMGTLTCDPGGCTFKPGLSFQGTTRFKYTATNGSGGSDTAIVKIRVGGTNTTPMPANDSFSTPKNTVLRFSSFELLRNDYDEDDDPLAALVYPATTAKGTLSCDAKGYWCTYTPLPNVIGTDTFSYTLSDGIASVTSTSSTFTINIQP
ncbi:MAG TPA: Ig-like domain-containing protein [Thermoanaerobaculia bacterium]|nr:Ig-like domain-containing protein [Thermoanaerobaculia bacterium]